MPFQKGCIPWNKGKTGVQIYLKGGHHNLATEFKKGHIPWHKNKTGVYSKEALGKMSESHIGQTSGNKGKKQPHTEEWKGMMREKFKGENHWNWQGGITSLQRRIRNSFEYRLWRSDVFTRDNFTCQECGRKPSNIRAHHITTFSDIVLFNDIRTFEQAKECEELWNINNGITFCEKCHLKKRNIGREQCLKERVKI